MRRKHVLLISLSTVTAIVSSLVAYSTKLQPTDEPQWFSSWVYGKRATLAFALLALSWLGAIVEWVRAYLAERHHDKAVLQRIVDDFARTQFKSRVRKNRLTVFKVTSGFRCFGYSMVRLPLLEKGYKWRAASRLKFRSNYLGIYLRASETRNVKSTTALRISDNPDECEGMAGLVWEETSCILPNLPKIDPADVRRVSSLDALPFDHPIRQYARATNIRDIVLLQSMENLARHFMGYIIRRSDGTPWGVILLDSEEEHCPFETPGGAPFAEKLSDCARVLGKVVT